MKKLIDWMTNTVGPKASKMAKNPWIASVQETMVATMPVMLISSFITILSILNIYLIFQIFRTLVHLQWDLVVLW